MGAYTTHITSRLALQKNASGQGRQRGRERYEVAPDVPIGHALPRRRKSGFQPLYSIDLKRKAAGCRFYGQQIDLVMQRDAASRMELADGDIGRYPR